jgi:thiamine biosynthesis lipoprotein
MGTILEITVVSRDETEARAVIERCYAEVARLEMIFTTWREDGELARLNARAGKGPQKASPELIGILLDARGFARDTGGTFDVTVGPLVEMWRSAGERGVLPSDSEVAAARSRVGIERLRIDPADESIALEADAAIDVGGLAKGWTLDRIGELLRAEGATRALLDFGGSSVLALGRPARGRHWRVRVAGGPTLKLSDVSLSVSDSFGQFVEVAGRRFGHIVDPRTGRALTRAQRSIVLARLGSTAEAWSTALAVFPPKEGIARVQALGEIQARVDGANGEREETRAFHLVADAESRGRERR